MPIQTTLKRAPRWAWYIAGGVGLGAVAVRVYKGRATDTPDTPSNDPTVAGSPLVTGAPSPVIVPPVIMQGDSGGGGNQPDISWLAGLLGTVSQSVDNAVGTIGGLASGDQMLAGTAIAQTGQIATAVIASGGGAPQPAIQAPPVVNVYMPAATPTPRPVPTPVKTCPASYPRLKAGTAASPATCYKCEKAADKASKYPYVHVYQDGHRIGVSGC